MTNCPPNYQNIGCESFRDGKKVTAQLLRQFCKNDAYLYEQIVELWDKTDPESRKRFYPPYFMDSGKSFGIEPCKVNEFAIGSSVESLIHMEDIIEANSTEYDRLSENLDESDYMNDFYHLSNSTEEIYRFNFDKTDDRTHRDELVPTTLYIDSDNLIEDDSTLHVITEYDSNNQTVKYSLLPYSVTDTINAEIPYTIGTKKTVKTKEDVFAKKSNLDAYCDGAYHDWKCNSVWYIGYNRHKNYNIKNAWRKNPDRTDIPSVCRAQTFKAKNSGLLTKVGFMMRGSKNSASPCIVEIRATNKKGRPTNKVLARTEQKFNHSTNSMVNFTFEKGCVVKKGETYAIVLRSPLSQFNHCYWIGGWASSCFSNSRKRAYYDGETFLSEDNGKTWIVHGKKEKCYGSHYYDWGFAEAPVNFGFEVYIAPKTGTKDVKKTTDTTQNKTYLHSFTFDYYAKGDYYLNFKGFIGGLYNKLQCSTSLPTDSSNLYSWVWQVYDNINNTWYDIDKFPSAEKWSGGLSWNTPRVFVKVRLKLHLTNNIFVDSATAKSEFEEILEEVKGLKLKTGSDGETKFNNWKKSVSNKIQFGKTIGQPTELSIRLNKSPSSWGYLHTLNYHPEQDTMLPACIWSEVNVNGLKQRNSDVKIDIVHEEEKIERFILVRTDNFDVLNPYLMAFLGEDGYALCDKIYPYRNSSETVRDKKMNDYIVDSKYYLTSEGEEFYEYLKSQNPPVYFLPQHDVSYFEGLNEDCLIFEDYPSYPINNVTMNSESNITLDWSDLKISGANVTYTLTRAVEIDQIIIRYCHKESSEEWEYSEKVLVNKADNANAYDYSINGNTITFNISTKYSDGTNELDDCLLKQFLKIESNTLKLVADTTELHPSDSNIVIETVDKNLNEFEHYLVDYENKMVKFINPNNLVEGDIRFNYNPVWCRNLGLDDFPLKMDLWIETYKVRINDNGLKFFDKIYTTTDTSGETEDHFIYATVPYTITTSTAPRDNIRSIIKNDDNTGNRDSYVEDTDFKVDYLTNKIMWLKDDNFEDGDIITVRYTPNLTDNGLALVYKLYRSQFFRENVFSADPLTKDTFDLLYHTSYTVEKYDDVFIGSNYWTYRT